MGAAPATSPGADRPPGTPSDNWFTSTPTGDFEATLVISEPHSLLEAVRRKILGNPLAQHADQAQRLGRASALAILSSDALSSVAYGTEASLAVLLAAGVGALSINVIIGLLIAALMLIVANSYRQTIIAYPSGGGSYIVARDNLGVYPGLVAAAALLVDYLLTVSVSVAAGVDAIASAFPAITPARVPIEVGVILFIMFVNLRGIREAANIFALPTFAFLLSFGLLIVFGIIRALTTGGLLAARTPPATDAGMSPLTVMLVLTAFASGCSAMTGVEAISNSVPIFKGQTRDIQARNAVTTLTTMIVILATFFLGTTYLAWRLGIAPNPASNPTVTAQIAQFAFTGAAGWLFYVVQTATFLILIFAANTSFTGFPRLAALLGNDNYLPAFFAWRGERLAFSVGIVFLGISSTLVLVIFRGNLSDLINLYALGVFTAFTLSQTGMVWHWMRRPDAPGRMRRMFANGVGAVATLIVTIVIAVAKFDRGAWAVVVLVPLLVLLFQRIFRYYNRKTVTVERLVASDERFAVAIVPIFSRLSSMARLGRVLVDHPPLPPNLAAELQFAARRAPEVVAVNVVSDEDEAQQFRQYWERELASTDLGPEVSVRLETILSPYRTIVLPLANFLRWRYGYGKVDRAAVILPQRIDAQWWELLLRRRIASIVQRELEQDAPASGLRLLALPYKTARLHTPPAGG